jgi:hypothetical protein
MASSTGARITPALFALARAGLTLLQLPARRRPSNNQQVYNELRIRNSVADLEILCGLRRPLTYVGCRSDRQLLWGRSGRVAQVRPTYIRFRRA